MYKDLNVIKKLILDTKSSKIKWRKGNINYISILSMYENKPKGKTYYTEFDNRYFVISKNIASDTKRRNNLQIYYNSALAAADTYNLYITTTDFEILYEFYSGVSDFETASEIQRLYRLIDKDDDENTIDSFLSKYIDS